MLYHRLDYKEKGVHAIAKRTCIKKEKQQKEKRKKKKKYWLPSRALEGGEFSRYW